MSGNDDASLGIALIVQFSLFGGAIIGLVIGRRTHLHDGTEPVAVR